jgi:hypothetical protein
MAAAAAAPIPLAPPVTAAPGRAALLSFTSIHHCLWTALQKRPSDQTLVWSSCLLQIGLFTNF